MNEVAKGYKLLLNIPIKREALDRWSPICFYTNLHALGYGNIYERHLGAGFLQQDETLGLPLSFLLLFVIGMPTNFNINLHKVKEAYLKPGVMCQRQMISGVL